VKELKLQTFKFKIYHLQTIKKKLDTNYIKEIYQKFDDEDGVNYKVLTNDGEIKLVGIDEIFKVNPKLIKEFEKKHEHITEGDNNLGVKISNMEGKSDDLEVEDRNPPEEIKNNDTTEGFLVELHEKSQDLEKKEVVEIKTDKNEHKEVIDKDESINLGELHEESLDLEKKEVKTDKKVNNLGESNFIVITDSSDFNGEIHDKEIEKKTSWRDGNY